MARSGGEGGVVLVGGGAHDADDALGVYGLA